MMFLRPANNLITKTNTVQWIFTNDKVLDNGSLLIHIKLLNRGT
jgi:hypothetical protein